MIQQVKARWRHLPRKSQQRLLSGLSMGVAILVAVVAASGLHGYWRDVLLGLCSVVELGVIVLQIRIGRPRNAHHP